MAMPELPKISQFTRVLITPEASFEKMVMDATKLELPSGPLSMLTKLQESLEVGKAPELPEMPEALALPTLPPLPGAGAGAGAGAEKTAVPRIGKKEVERKTGIQFQVC